MAFLDDARHSNQNIRSPRDTLEVIAFLIGFWSLVMLLAGVF
jgi:hypothetical protein